MSSDATVTPVDAATLPSFTNHPSVCARCGARWGIRVHFDRGCKDVQGGDHFAGTCFARSALSKCHLGAPGTLAERTPPEGCIVYVNDGGTPCAALIKGCTPGARMRDASFTAVNDARGVLFNGVFHPGAKLTSTSLPGANLTGAANLSGADLGDGQGNLPAANLSGANMSGMDLNDADLSEANLTGASLQGVDFTAARLGGVTWGSTLCPDATFSNSNGSSPESCCAHLNGKVPLACSP